jgi:hypothetical protein
MRFVSTIGLLLLAAPLAAQEAAPAPAKKEKKICRSVAATGSILGGKRQCHTKAEWDAISDQARLARDKRERDMQDGSAGGTGVSTSAN